mmetsp:Transcript_43723/g.135017  ORF Transcript_43723/g.135017 Transcript_43723/m.135017 type:complete len:640 (-) Transcript_43723:27-1946(-)
MMRASKIGMPFLAAKSAASLLIGTSKASTTACFFERSFIATVLIRWRLCSGPSEMADTGIFDSLRKERSASSAPRVDDWTVTPTPLLSTSARISLTSDMMSFFIFSTSSPGFTTYIGVPGTASSRSCAEILRPMAARSFLWCTYSPLTRSSFIGCGVSRARTWVTMGPLRPHTMMVSDSCSTPLTSTTSMVVPKPWIGFTSRTVHASSSLYWTLPSMKRWTSWILSIRRSLMPSPDLADVGTTETYRRMSVFFQCSAALKPSSANSVRMRDVRVSNSERTCGFCISSVCWMSMFSCGTHSWRRSTLLRATMNGHLRSRRRRSDSFVCGSRPCMMSTTSTEMSQSDEPRLRRLVKDSWPGVSMTSRPGTRISTGSVWRARRSCVDASSDSLGKNVAPICCVIPPASPPCTLVRRMRSSSEVLPVSTWPRTQQIGERMLDAGGETQPSDSAASSSAFLAASAAAASSASFSSSIASSASQSSAGSSAAFFLAASSSAFFAASAAGSTCFGFGTAFLLGAGAGGCGSSRPATIMPAARIRSRASFCWFALLSFFSALVASLAAALAASRSSSSRLRSRASRRSSSRMRRSSSSASFLARSSASFCSCICCFSFASIAAGGPFLPPGFGAALGPFGGITLVSE